MKENNLQKKPSSAREYANLFLLDENGKKKDFSNVKNVCLITIGYAETTWILLQEFTDKNITIIDRKSEIDFIETLIKIHKRNDIRIERIEVETDEEALSTILKLNMNTSFDLIIANPPYGDDNKGTLPRKIVKAVKKCAKESVWLMPMTHFQYDNLFKEIASFKRFSKIESQNIFEGASCPPLSIVRFDGKEHNLFKDKFDYSLPRTPLVNAFRQYNKIHPSCCDLRSAILRHSNLGVNDGKSPSAFDPDTFKLYDQSFYERTLVFGMYWISNGMHTDEGNAIDNFWNYKLDNYEDFQAKVKELGAHPDLHAATFNSKMEKQNCEKYRHGRLYSKLLSEFDNGGSIDYIKLCIPNLDWSHPWTDQEILKELGLPEDFLGE